MTICECGCHETGQSGNDEYPHTEYCNKWRRDVDGEFAAYWDSLTLTERAEIRRRLGQGVE
jgi:hypothetical protein